MSVQTQAPSRRDESLNETWNRYWSNRDLVHRNELIVAYQPLVHDAVRRLPGYVRAHWEDDELRSFGQDGLVKAISRWAQNDSTKFGQYASYCIRGAIFDELRRLDWMPRTVRQRVVAYKATHDTLLASLGRVPSSEEVCAAMGLTERQIVDLMGELNACQLLHLEGRVDPSPGATAVVDVVADDAPLPEAEFVASSEIDALHNAMATLSEREHTVVFLAFIGGLTQEQIGSIIGVGGPQVCKIQGNALRKMHSVLAPIRAEVSHAASDRAFANAPTPDTRASRVHHSALESERRERRRQAA